MANKLTLHEYQKNAVRHIYKHKKVPLFLGMGMGKTAITLVAMSLLLRDEKIKSILIVAPLYVAHSVWHNEAAKWLILNQLTFSLVLGTEKQRIEALNSTAHVYIVNRENLVWLSKYRRNFDMIVLDESSSFKNPSSQRFYALKKMKSEYLVALTGTPSPNGLLDLWSQIYLMDRGLRLGTSMKAYKEKYFNSDYMGYKFTPKDPELIYKQIEDIAISMSPEDYLSLPERIDLVTHVHIDKTKEYKELESKFITHINNFELTASNAATLAGKLLQFCNGAIYDEDKNIIEVHSAKLDALEGVINDNPNNNVLVAYNFNSDLKRLKQRFKNAHVFTPGGDTIDRWNRGEIKMLLCHPASAGKGLNLQAGGCNIIWFGLTWNLEDYLQFNARLHRQGQTKPVVVNHLVAKGGMDELVMKALRNKEVNQKELLNSLAVCIVNMRGVL
jgi:SNF2 family DNA or RNA helicase